MQTLDMLIQTGWLPLLLGVLLVLAYELCFLRQSRRHPLRFARTTHARLRTRWVHELMQTPGSELLAIQTIRNSVMSSTVTASTSILALMGAVTLFGGRQGPDSLHAIVFGPQTVLAALLLTILFMAFLLSAMAVRFFNHAGYLMGSQAQGETRGAISDLAARYMERAGNYYSQGLRALLWLAPAAIGLVNPWLMPIAVAALIYGMALFDRSPEPVDARLLTMHEVQ